MQRIYRFFLGWIKSAVESLAFLPLPMMIVGFVLGFGLFYLEVNANIRDYTPAVMVSSPSHQRLIRTETEALQEDARTNISNSKDRRVITREIMIVRNGLKRLFEDSDFLLDAHLREVGTKS